MSCDHDYNPHDSLYVCAPVCVAVEEKQEDGPGELDPSCGTIVTVYARDPPRFEQVRRCYDLILCMHRTYLLSVCVSIAART